MNKQELLDKIEQQESELAELKAQVGKLKEPEKKTGRVLSLEGFEEGYGVYVSGTVCSLSKTDGYLKHYFNTGCLFYDEESAKRYVKYLQLWQKARQFMADDWGDEVVDWNKSSQTKYILIIYCNKIESDMDIYLFSPLHFKSEQSLEEFRQQFSDDDIRLMLMGV